MRKAALFAAAGLAVLVIGCGTTGTGPEGGSGGGGPDPTQNTQNGMAPDGLSQYVTITGPSASTGTGGNVEMTVQTWVQNLTSAPITAVLRACALQPGDLTNTAGVTFSAPDQATCGADSTVTVTLQPFASTLGTLSLQDTYIFTTLPSGQFQLNVQYILQQVAPAFAGPYVMSVTVGSG